MGDREVFNDPIHGLIELHPLLVKIINTPQFQRLRNIKQLGMCYYVYPGASHNRFEHCIGVCHLAGRFVRKLRSKLEDPKGNTKGLNIDDKDELCVEIAGLCHDLGHGPLSHLFDKIFVKRVLEEERKKQNEEAKVGDEDDEAASEKKKQDYKETLAEHEERSVLVLKYLIKANELMDEFKKNNLSEEDIDFIGELITASESKEDTESWTFKGRPEEKSFLYEIVANKRNNIDVDKWDYFARDCYMLGMKNEFDHNRCIQFARVIKVGRRTHICYRDKGVYDLYEMFHTRFNLHERACQHHTTRIIEQEVAEVLWKAKDDPNIKFKGMTISDIVLSGNIKAFCRLTDDVLSEIWNRGNPEAKNHLKMIYKRMLPKLVGQTSLSCAGKKDIGSDEDVKKEIINGLNVQEQDVKILTATTILAPLESNFWTLQKWVPMNYGMEDKNPMDNVYFYAKDMPGKAFKIKREQVSRLLPNEFSELKLRVYCRNKDACKELRGQFTEWCKRKGLPLPPSSGHGE